MFLQRSILPWFLAALLTVILYTVWQFNRFEEKTRTLLTTGGESTALTAFREEMLRLQISRLNTPAAVDSAHLQSLLDRYQTFLIHTDLSGMTPLVSRLDSQLRRYTRLLRTKNRTATLTKSPGDTLTGLSKTLFYTLNAIGEELQHRSAQREAAFEAARTTFFYRSDTALALLMFLAVAGLTANRNRERIRAKKLERSLKSLHDGSGFIELSDESDDLLAALAIEFNRLKKQLDAYESYPLPELILARPETGKIASPLNMGLMVLDKNGRNLLRYSPAIPRLLQTGHPPARPPLPLQRFLQNSPYHSRSTDFSADTDRMKTLKTPQGGWLALFTIKNNDSINVIVQDLSFLRIQELARKEFIAYISHEIKTPLTSMSLAVHNLLTTEPDPGRLREIGRLLKDDLFRLRQFTKNMLLIAMLDDEKHIPEKEKSDLTALLRQIISDISPTAGKKEITVELTAPDAVKAGVNPVLIGHALLNILHNALRFSPARATVHVLLEETASGITIRVRDQGPGVDKTLLQQLNEGPPRYTLKDDQEEAHFGLGFYLSSRILERHGGRLTINNHEDGACVTLWLPREDTNA